MIKAQERKQGKSFGETYIHQCLINIHEDNDECLKKDGPIFKTRLSVLQQSFFVS